ncbi:hypothetical protein ACQ4PT_010921 [Festuca glaucescens]
MVVVLLLASLPMLVVSSVHPSDPADSSDGAPERIGHLHLEGRGSDKITVALHGANLHVPRFANHDGAWHAWADDLHGLTPPTPMSCDDDNGDDYYASVVSGHKRLKDLRRRVGRESLLDGLFQLARDTARTLDDSSRIISLILDGRHGEPDDIWKTMSCAVLISEQNGGAWWSKEAMQPGPVHTYTGPRS